MLNIFMTALSLAFAVTTFLGNFQYGRWIHGYLALYSGVAEGAVINYDDEGHVLPQPYFDEDIFEILLGEFIADNLSPYAKTSYQFYFYYDGEFAISAEVNIYARFMLGFQTMKEAVFSIVPQEYVND
ncbi:MAG: hypothetical protein II520_03600 [Bacilli bacterium]|nr:hypothetical protein [Bacilli bacterium]